MDCKKQQSRNWSLAEVGIMRLKPVFPVGVVAAFALILIAGCPGITPPPNGNGNGTPPEPKAFVGAATCQLCHPGVHAEWTMTLHSGALETLKAIGQGQNAACVGCHTVGFGETDGFVNETLTPHLAGVQCENCHGPAGDHTRDPANRALRPPIYVSGSLCGECHTGAHHPNFEQWSESRHSRVEPHVAESFAEGTSLNNCGTCHSGDFRWRAIIRGETVPDTLLVGMDPQDMNAVTCMVCHDPHAQTGNAVQPEDGRDYQLRYRQVASPTPSGAIEDVTNPERFNLCGQCHHSRGRTWQSSARGPHHSVQANIYAGEMPVQNAQDGEQPLVLPRVSVHTFATEQCSTCHMYRQDFMSDLAPAISGHNFTVNNAGCATAGCHPSTEQAIQAQTILQGEMQARLDMLADRMGHPSAWEYTSNGGPDAEGQALLPDELKQARFLYYYVISDGSLGVHNPAYVRDMVTKAESLLEAIGM